MPANMPAAPPLRAGVAAAAGVAALSAAFTFVPWLHAHGLYLRDAVLDGSGGVAGLGGRQWWRIATAMWVHLDWRHWLGNVMAATGLLLLTWRHVCVPVRGQIAVLVLCGIAAQLALLAVPSIAWYGGLSGALHGLALWSGLRMLARPAWPASEGIGRGRAIGVVLVAIVLGKVWVEQSWLAPLVLDRGWGFSVVRAAHAAGALGGAALWLLGEWRRRRAPTEGP